MSITVITPSLPERAVLLAEAIASAQAQTLPAHDHFVMFDSNRAGPALVRNRMLEDVETDLVAFLDDDDILYPDHLALLEFALNGADLAFSWHDDGPDTPRVQEWGAEAIGWMTSRRNIIPVTVLARTEAIRRAGGFYPQDRYEDYELWMRMLGQGCRFVCAPVVTWRYRITQNGRTYAP